MPDSISRDTAPVTAHAATGGVVAASPPVAARWEFRWMDHALPADADAIARWSPGPVTTSAETYLVSFRTAHNAKLRQGVVDLKRLRQISADGLEQWEPVLKSPGPLTPDQLEVLCASWGVAPPAHRRGPVPLDDLWRFVDRHPDLRRIDLVKRRRRIAVAGCRGEITEIDVAGQHWMSLAFEDEDPALVRAVLAGSGLDPRFNLNYPAALRRLFLRPRAPGHAVEGAP
jgi:hypothetical protein